MKKCGKCNAENSDKSSFCVKCGNNLDPVTVVEEPKKSTLSFVGFICGICGFATCGVSSVVGLILSIIGLVSNKKKNIKDGFGIAGIILSLLPLVLLIFGFTMAIITAKDVTVTDFSTMTKEEAEKWCDDSPANCSFTEEYSDTIPSGGFISQDKEAGKVIKSYDNIHLVYSKGKRNETTKIPETSKVPEESTPTVPKTTKNEKYSLIEDNISSDSNEFSTYIEGKIKNNTNKTLSYIQVIYTIYDADGNTIGTCIDNENSFDAYGTWKFKAICIEDVNNVAKYELKEITGW